MRNRLKVIRAERRLSGWAAAKLAGLEYQTFHRIEIGAREPSEDEQAAIAQAFNLPPETVWTDEPLFESSSI